MINFFIPNDYFTPLVKIGQTFASVFCKKIAERNDSFSVQNATKKNGNSLVFHKKFPFFAHNI
ncbi:hypothetical protein, partial [Enterococcus sp. 2201sp1_2201st1_B8_2201SCRN_220225]|uniref:hypothetical protein n=1 Tax=Enterococcus sp. 2201sp1_2201st1_B8_2201SCRN_220225 TaxID=3141592 RepID=UPI0034A41A71